MAKKLYQQQFINIARPNLEISQEISDLQKAIKSQEIASIAAVFDDKTLKSLKKIAQKISSYQKIFVLGVGGSSLGAKTLASLKSQDKLVFLESIDTSSVFDEIEKIDFEKSFFLVVSKSGETIETVCQALVVLDRVSQANPDNFLFITEDKDSVLTRIAKKIGAQIIFHPKEIGGRFSVFSVVGLLPALICGVDVDKVLSGARKIVEDFLSDEDGFAACACRVQLDLYERGFRNNVVMPYIDRLKNFTDWYRQLWAESLGKNGFGSTPINSMGTVDQHSQLQLYLEGPSDKFFTFFTLKNHQKDFLLRDLEGCETLFGGKKLSEIVKVEQETTIQVLRNKNLPIRVFEIDNFDEEVLGGLMMQMFLETILMASYKKINPFDQPAVELRKDLAREILQK